MFARHRILAGASAVALAAGTTLAGAGIAGAQGSSEIAADLNLAATALNAPVAVNGNDEGGPTVAYTNGTGADQTCVGFTLPYSTVDELGVDPSAIGDDPFAALPLLAQIEAEGGVSVLTTDAEGDPIANDSGPGSTITDAAISLLEGDGVTVPEDSTVEWEATSPETPAAAVLLCVPDPDGGLLAISFGIDEQVVVDQLNGIPPGGSIGAGSVSGGSVGAGASLLGSLADDAGDDKNGDDEGAAGSGSASSTSAGSTSAGNDTDGEIPVETVE
jgi:hypothetical protein